jgi:hypothetical protein
MPLSDSQKAALNRLQSFYEGDNPYNSVSNPGGFRQGGHLYNFVPALKDLASVITGCAALAVEVATNSAQSPKAVRVDGDQTYTDAEKAQGQKNLGLAQVLTSFVAKAGDTMKGVLNMAFANPYISLVNKDGGTWDGYKWNILHYGPDGCYYLQAVDAAGNGSNPLQLKRDGSMILSQIGDLNTRIETRAAAFAAQRLALTGGTLTGTLSIAMDNPVLYFNQKGGTYDGLYWCSGFERAAGNYYIQSINAQGAGTDSFRFRPDGSIYIPQFGDLNTRIETRGAAYRDAAQAFATNADLAKVSKAGDTMTGRLQAPYFEVTGTDGSAGVRFASRDNKDQILLVNQSNKFGIYDITSQVTPLEVNLATGELKTSQFGDLSARIEARGLAYQQAAQATSVQTNVGGRQEMQGPLAVASYFDIVRGNVLRARITIDGGGTTILQNGDNGDNFFYVTTGGVVWTKQFGDLNSRIESRGQAYSDAAFNRCFSQGRYVFVGDYDITGNYNGGMVEPFSPSVCTGRSSITSGDGNDIIIRAMRFRRPQFYLPNAGWVDVGYA